MQHCITSSEPWTSVQAAERQDTTPHEFRRSRLASYQCINYARTFKCVAIKSISNGCNASMAPILMALRQTER